MGKKSVERGREFFSLLAERDFEALFFFSFSLKKELPFTGPSPVSPPTP
jgi:hypothetical protein